MNSEAYERGLRVRRDVLGSEYVDRALGEADDFTQDLQTFITEFGWGSIWARDGLDMKVRSLVTMALLIALNRPAELRLHIRGALRNGASRREILEVLLQAIPYAGFPAALDAFSVAKEVFAAES